MAAQDTVKRDILNHLSIKGKVGGRDPIAELCRVTKNDTVPGRNLVKMVVRDLTESGEIIVKRGPHGRIVEILHRRPRLNVDRTEWSAAQKREHTFAKGVSAFLPDSMCGPVVITQGVPKRREPDATTRQPLVYDENAPHYVNLTTCLRALHEAADADGLGKKGVNATLIQIGGMTLSRVLRAQKHLSGMGLYVTSMVGYQHSDYLLDMSRQEVTKEMLVEYRRSLPASRAVETEPGNEPERTQPQSEPEPDVEPQLEVEPGVTTEIRLAAIVEALESEVAELNQRRVSLDDQLAGASREVDRLQAENDDLRRHVAELLARLDRPVDPRVQAILARHQGPSTVV